MAGRPSDYDRETALKICDQLALGKSLRKICDDPAMPGFRTVFQWLESNQEFAQQYARAREIQADYLAEEGMDIADSTQDPAKARLQIDARKWFASKVAPKKYGDKITQEFSGPDGGPIPTSLEVSFVRPSEAAKTED
jgi:hypothetical protein